MAANQSTGHHTGYTDPALRWVEVVDERREVRKINWLCPIDGENAVAAFSSHLGNGMTNEIAHVS